MIHPSYILIFCSILIHSILHPLFKQSPVMQNETDTLAKDTVIYIKAMPGLQYDLPRFAVKPGTHVTLILENTDDMAHNLLITEPGARLEVVAAAQAMGNKGPELHYTPATPKVLWGTKVLEPAQKQSIQFTVPDAEVIYPYVCTLPGHGYVMYGAMYVTTKPLPPLTYDENVSPNKKMRTTPTTHGTQGAVHPTSPHPFPVTLPALYRTFMPDCSPAAIAVGLPGDVSYCWDAGTCRLRYAWTGGFVDNTEHWNGKKQEFTQVVGNIYYRDAAGFPFRIGKADALPDVQFKGYQLVDRYPQFMYTMDNILVKELVKPAENNHGIVREFTITDVKKPVYFLVAEADSLAFSSSVGKFQKGVLKLSPKQARHFTVSISQKKETL
jgi:azurin